MDTQFARTEAKELDLDPDHLCLCRDEIFVELLERPGTAFLGVPSYQVAVRDCLSLGKSRFLLKVRPDMYRILLSEVSADHVAHSVYSLAPDPQWRVVVTNELAVEFAPESAAVDRWASLDRFFTVVERPACPEDGTYALRKKRALDPISAIKEIRFEEAIASVSPVIIALGTSIPRSRSPTDLIPERRLSGPPSTGGKSGSVENRRHVRYSTDFLVRATLLTSEGTLGGTCRDLSLGGAFIESERPLPRGRVLQLLIKLASIGESLYTEAQVVWTRSAGDSRGPSGMGLKFIGLNETARDRLRRALDELRSPPG